MHTDLLTALRLDSSGVPIYVQLREQILRHLGAGLLAPGEQMPTMREVAVALKVDLNTVRHAYDELERLGAITLVRHLLAGHNRPRPTAWQSSFSQRPRRWASIPSPLPTGSKPSPSRRNSRHEQLF